MCPWLSCMSSPSVLEQCCAVCELRRPNLGPSRAVNMQMCCFDRASLAPCHILLGLHDLQDLHGMIDAAKYADLVLLMVDGGFGFEMETFEFLNLLQVWAHGLCHPASPLSCVSDLPHCCQALPHHCHASVTCQLHPHTSSYPWCCAGLTANQHILCTL